MLILIHTSVLRLPGPDSTTNIQSLTTARKKNAAMLKKSTTINKPGRILGRRKRDFANFTPKDEDSYLAICSGSLFYSTWILVVCFSLWFSGFQLLTVYSHVFLCCFVCSSALLPLLKTQVTRIAYLCLLLLSSTLCSLF